MKNNRGITFITMLIMAISMAFATQVFAWQSGTMGDLPTFGTYGGAALYTTDFAPDSVQVVDMKTKGGYANFPIDKLIKYQFTITKLSDNTAVTCKSVFGGYSSVYGTTGTNAFQTSGAGPWHTGTGATRLGVYACASTSAAARPQLTIYKQRKQ